MASKNVIEIVLKAVDNASKVADNVEKNLNKIGNSTKGINNVNNALTRQERAVARLRNAYNTVSSGVSSAFEKIRSATNRVTPSLTKLANNFRSLGNSITNTAEKIRNKWVTAFQNIKSKSDSVSNGMVSKWISSAKNMREAFVSGIRGIPMTTITDGVNTFRIATFDATSRAARGFYQVGTAINSVYGRLQSFTSTASASISTMASRIQSSFRNIQTAFSSGMSGNPFQRLADGSYMAAFNASSAWARAANQIGLSLNGLSTRASTITSGISNAFNSLSTRVSAVGTSIRNGLGTAFDGLTSKAQTVSNGITTAFSGISSRVSGVASSVRDTLGNAFSIFGNRASSSSNQAKNGLNDVGNKSTQTSSQINQLSMGMANMGLRASAAFRSVGTSLDSLVAHMAQFKIAITSADGSVKTFGVSIQGAVAKSNNMANSIKQMESAGYGLNTVSGALGGIGQKALTSGQEVDNLNRKLRETGTSGGAGISSLGQKLTNLRGRITGLASGFSGIQGAISTAFGVVGVSSMYQFTIGAARARETLMSATQSVYGSKQAADQLKASVSKATSGGVVGFTNVMTALNRVGVQFHLTSDQASQLAPAMNSVGTVAKSLGYDGTASMNMMQKAMRGLNGDTVTLWRGFSITKEQLMDAGWSGAASDVEGYGNAIQKLVGNTKEYQAYMNSTEGQMEMFKMSIQGVGRSIGEIVLPVLNQLLHAFNALAKHKTLLTIIVGIGVALMGLSSVSMVVLPIIELATALGLIGPAGVTAAAGEAAAGAGAAGASVGFGLLSTSMLPVIAAVAGIVALGVAVYELGKYFGWWSDVGSMISAISAGLQRMFSAFKNNKDVQMIVKGIGDALNVVGGIIGAFIGWLAGLDGSVQDSGNRFDIVHAIIIALGAAFNIVSTPIRLTINLFRLLYSALSDPIGALNSLKDSIMGFINGGIANISQWLSGVGNAIMSWITGLPGQITGWLSGVWTGISTWFGTLISNMWTWLTDIGSAIAGWLISLPGQIAVWLVGVWTSISTWFVTLISNLGTWLGNVLMAISNWFISLPATLLTYLNIIITTISTWIMTLITQLATWGVQILESIYNWFLALPETLLMYLNVILNTIGTWIINLIINLATWELQILTSIITFLIQLPITVLTYLNTLLTSIATWAMSLYNQAVQAGSNFVNGFITWITGLPGRFWNWLMQTLNRINPFKSQGSNGMQSTGQKLVNAFIGFIQTLPGRFWQWLRSTINRINPFSSQGRAGIMNAGRQMVTGFGNSIRNLPQIMWQELMRIGDKIRSASGQLVQAIIDLGKNLLRNFKHALGIGSPGYMYYAIVGEMGYINTELTKSQSKLGKKTEELGQAMMDGFNSADISSLSDSVQQATTQVQENIEQTQGPVSANSMLGGRYTPTSEITPDVQVQQPTTTTNATGQGLMPDAYIPAEQLTENANIITTQAQQLQATIATNGLLIDTSLNTTRTTWNNLVTGSTVGTQQLQANNTATIQGYNRMTTQVGNELNNLKTKNTQAWTNVKTTTQNNLNTILSSTKSTTTQMVSAWQFMKNQIIAAASEIRSKSQSHFNQLSNTIGSFYRKLRNPGGWGTPHTAGTHSRTRFPRVRSSSPSGGSSGINGVRNALAYGANAVATQKIATAQNSITPTMAKLDLDVPRVDLEYMLPNSRSRIKQEDLLKASDMKLQKKIGAGWRDVVSPNYNYIKTTTDKWWMNGPLVGRYHTVDNLFQVKDFENGTPHIPFDTFRRMAEAVFSQCDYDFYWDSAKYGNWVTAFNVGKMNCSDSTDAIIWMARACGLSARKVHGYWGSLGHYWAEIAGHKMDTTGWMNRRTWTPSASHAGPAPRSVLTKLGNSNQSSSSTNDVNHDGNISLDVNVNINGGDNVDSEIIASAVRDALQSKDVLRALVNNDDFQNYDNKVKSRMNSQLLRG